MLLPDDMSTFKGVSGVYLMTCLANGKIYIGSSVDIVKRYHEHMSGLRNGRHHSRYMMRSWVKYGDEQFTFSVLETCHESKVLEREQWYLDTFRPYDPTIGFNNSQTAESNAGFKMSEESKERIRQSAKNKPPMTERTKEGIRQSWVENGAKWTQDSINRRGISFDIRSPSGEVVHVHGLKRFARQHGLDRSQLTRLLKGEHQEVKGWTLPGIILPSGHDIQDPHGNVFHIPRKGIRAFSKERGLNPCSIARVLRGAIDGYKGWTLYRQGTPSTVAA